MEGLYRKGETCTFSFRIRVGRWTWNEATNPRGITWYINRISATSPINQTISGHKRIVNRNYQNRLMHFDAVCLLGNALRPASIYVYQSYDRWNHHLFVLSTGESSNRSSRPRHNRPPRRVKFRLFPRTRKRTARFLFFLFVFLLTTTGQVKERSFLLSSLFRLGKFPFPLLPFDSYVRVRFDGGEN